MSLPYMRLFVGDYLSDTSGLTAEVHGAYLLLLMSMWKAGGYLPNDPSRLARFAACTPTRWGRIKSEIMPFFEVVGDRITHVRILTECEIVAENAIKYRENGKSGAKAKALKKLRAAQALASKTGEKTGQNVSIPYSTEDTAPTERVSSGGKPSSDRPDGSSSACPEPEEDTPEQAARKAIAEELGINFASRYFDGSPVADGVIRPGNDIAAKRLIEAAEILARFDITIGETVPPRQHRAAE